MLACTKLNRDKQLIKKNFSEAVDTYDCSSDLQGYIVDILTKKILSLDLASGPILEFGCGTGLLTKRLLSIFPERDIFAFDLSFNMCKKAREKFLLSDKSIHFLVADVEYPSLVTDHFSAIFSSSSFQWVNFPQKTLLNLKKLLLPQGILIMSTFGPKTLKELSYSLSIYLNKEVTIAASKFLDEKQLINYFNNCFTNFKIRELLIIKRYPTLFDLLKTLRNTGANIKTSQLSSFVFTKKSIHLIDEIYKKEFGEIIASYQVFLCEAQK